MQLTIKSHDVILTLPGFSLADTLNCGQCFRWTETNGRFHGIAAGRTLEISQQGDQITFHNTDEAEFNGFWRNYFDLDTDYSAFQRIFCLDPTLQRACKYAGGIRILRQEPWEALCSFILSQNNNIPRIRGIIERLCKLFGNPISVATLLETIPPQNGPTAIFITDESKTVYSFPSPERLATASLEDLAPLRAGFRAKYVLDAARKIADETVCLETVKTAPYHEAQAELMKISGVGPKVADCALLFGFYRLEAFPEDVWVKRILKQFYSNGFPECCRPYGGVAQQYLFHYFRMHPEECR